MIFKIGDIIIDNEDECNAKYGKVTRIEGYNIYANWGTTIKNVKKGIFNPYLNDIPTEIINCNLVEREKITNWQEELE